jgi:hypothetical protein
MKQYRFTCRVVATGIGYVTAKSKAEAKQKCIDGDFDDITDETDHEYSDFDEFEEIKE